MAYAYNPNYSGGKDQKNQCEAAPGKKLARPKSINKPSMVVHACCYSHMHDPR
jgi:hypothetical protein